MLGPAHADQVEASEVSEVSEGQVPAREVVQSTLQHRGRKLVNLADTERAAATEAVSRAELLPLVDEAAAQEEAVSALMM